MIDIARRITILGDAMDINELPDEFTIEITEEDRQGARQYMHPCHCLVATAAKRTFPGLKWLEDPYTLTAESEDGQVTDFAHAETSSSALFSRKEATRKPFYTPEVVGKKILCTKVK